jgi:hypothetical protein
MRRALNLLREAIHYRRAAFDEGLQAAGFRLVSNLAEPGPGDLLVIWNRYGGFHERALLFERAGADVLVVENGYLGKAWRAGEWFALALSHHAGAGRWVDGGPSRWDSWGIKLSPWRDGGSDTLILGQRGIGEPDIRSPDRWAESARRRFGGRIRPHPESGVTSVPLLDDLASTGQVLTWNSSAALMALMAGIAVWHEFPCWIGGGAARPLSDWPGEPRRDDEARLAMFRRLAWAIWTLDEVRTGVPIARLTHAA